VKALLTVHPKPVSMQDYKSHGARDAKSQRKSDFTLMNFFGTDQNRASTSGFLGYECMLTLLLGSSPGKRTHFILQNVHRALSLQLQWTGRDVIKVFIQVMGNR